MIVAFMTERFRTGKNSVWMQRRCDFFQDKRNLRRREMADGPVPKNHVVFFARKRLPGRVAQKVGDISASVGAFRFADGRGFDIERVHFRALRGKEMICQKDVMRAERFRAVKRARKRIRAHGAIAESEQKPGQPVIGKVRPFLVQLPQAPEKTLVVSSKQPDEQLFLNLSAPEDSLLPPNERSFHFERRELSGAWKFMTSSAGFRLRSILFARCHKLPGSQSERSARRR